jgi:hypothetical protein
MGLDILRDGDGTMRLYLQGCLILWLCLFSTLSFAGFPALPDGAVVVWTKTASKNYTSESGPGSSPSETMGPQAEAWRDNCERNHPDKVCVVQTFNDPPEVRYVENDITYYRWNGGARMVAIPEGGYCEPPSYLNNDGVCETPVEPEECHENGEAYDPESQQCVTECEHGQLNGSCLPPPEEPNECNSDSSDYRGQIVQGYGKSPINFCGDIDQCSGDKPGQIGLVNGELRCIAEDYGVPKCKGDSISVVDDYGFVCEPLTNKPEEEPDTPEEPNTDTDGDGEPDEYQRENDPDAVNKGLDKVVDAINEGNSKTDKSNQHLGNIENAVKDIAKNVGSLKQMGENGELGGGGGGGGSDGGGEGLKNDQGEDYLSDLADIKENTKNTADGMEDLNEKLDNPEDGYSTDELEGTVPTFEESSDRLYNAIISNPTIEAVTTIPDLASNNTCPVYTMPSTEYWSAMTIDVHCVILNEHRGTLSTVFLIVWTLTAIMVFLRA